VVRTMEESGMTDRCDETVDDESDWGVCRR